MIAGTLDTTSSPPIKEVVMALRFLGKDPNSKQLAQLDIPEHETVIEFPSRMLQFLPGVKRGGGAVR